MPAPIAVVLAAAAATLFLHGNIYTLDPDRPRAEALVAEGGRIVYVGAEAGARARAGAAARVVDLGGRTALPGFIDAHAHLGGLGALARGTLDLRGTKGFDEVIAAVVEAARAKKPGEWVVGSGWDHESWPDRKLPSHEKLSAAVPDHPVWLSRVDGHMGLANRNAMDLAKVPPDWTPGAGGAFLRGADGAPLGLFVDNAIGRLTASIPEGGGAGYGDLVLAAQARCLAVGLTSVHDAGLDPAEVPILQRLADNGQLALAVYGMVSVEGNAAAGLAYVRKHAPLVRAGAAGQLTIRAIKLIADGAMGSRGAWLLAPYADRPVDEQGAPYLGLSVTSPVELEVATGIAIDRGYQVCTHAIGDAANRAVLDAYEAAGKSKSLKTLEPLRLRVEHAQLLSLGDIPRFAGLGVIASMQPTHATSDMRWAEARVGKERLRGAYAWASLLRSGTRLAFGSDFPVESHDPLLGIYAAVTRQDGQGSPAGGWLPGERTTREEAVRGFTSWAAYAAFEEDLRGTLAPGKRADLAVLSRDILTCQPAEILTTKVEMTILGGEVVYTVK